MGTEDIPGMEIQWFDNNLGTWQDITAEVKEYTFDDGGIQQIPEIELALYNTTGKYTNPGSAYYIDLYSIFRVRADVRGVWDTVFLGRVNEHKSKMRGKSADYMPLICRGMADILLRDTITYDYADRQEAWAPKTPALWTFRNMLQDFLGGGRSSGDPFAGWGDSGFSNGVVLESAYDASKIDGAVTAGMNFDETPLLNAVRDACEEIQYDGYMTGLLLSGRVLDLPFEWSAGTVAYDYSSNENDGTITGADWVNAKYGRGLQFVSGNSDYVTITHDITISLATDFSISCWIKTSTTPGGWRGIIDKSNGTVNYRIYINTDGSINFEIWDGINNPIAQSNSDLTDGAWHHIVAIRHTTDDKLYLYVDNVLQDDQQTDTTTGSITNTGDLLLGKNNGYWDGTLDELQIYNRTLSSQEVEMLYLHPRLRLVLYEVGDATYMNSSPYVTLTHPYKEIRMEQSLDDVMNHIYLVGGIDEGEIIRDKLTEQAVSKYSPAAWSMGTYGTGLTDSQDTDRVIKGEWSVKATTTISSGATHDANMADFILDITKLGTHPSGIDCELRHTFFKFKIWCNGEGWGSGPEGNPLARWNQLSIVLEDNASNQVIYNSSQKFQKSLWAEYIVPFPSEITKWGRGLFGLLTLESPARDIWYYVDPASSFDFSKVEKIGIYLNYRAHGKEWSAASPSGNYAVYIDDFKIGGGREIDPFLYPTLFPNSNANGGYENTSNINTYGIRSYIHRDGFVRTFEHAEDEANRILDQSSDPTKMKKINVIKGAKVWVKPHQNITLTASEYGLSSTVMRVTNIKHNYQRGNYYRVGFKCIQQTDPTPPVGGSPGKQLMLGMGAP